MPREPTHFAALPSSLGGTKDEFVLRAAAGKLPGDRLNLPRITEWLYEQGLSFCVLLSACLLTSHNILPTHGFPSADLSYRWYRNLVLQFLRSILLSALYYNLFYSHKRSSSNASSPYIGTAPISACSASFTSPERLSIPKAQYYSPQEASSTRYTHTREKL